MWCGKGPFPANKKNSDYIFLPEWKRRPTRRRGSSSIGTRESVRTSSIVRRFSPFVTRCAFVCFYLSFRHEICDVILEFWRGEHQIFSRLSQCNLQSILQPPACQPTDQPNSTTGSLTLSSRLAMELASLSRLVVTPITSFVRNVPLYLLGSALTTRI